MHVPQVPKRAIPQKRCPRIIRLMLVQLILWFGAKLALWTTRLGCGCRPAET